MKKKSLNKIKQKAVWLSELIKKDMEQYPSINFRKKVMRYFSTIYIPSKETILFILFLVISIWLLTNTGKILIFAGLEDWVLFRIHFYTEESNQFQNLIAIHAGIGAIIFALIILIAESLRDNQSKDTARVLLKVSYLFPLTVAEIFVFFLFLFGDINFLNILSVITIAVFTVISLKMTIKVLLDKPLFTKKRIELLNEGIKEKIDRAIDERIGNNIFLGKLSNSDQNLDYLIFLPDETNYLVINSDQYGIVDDINIGLLEEIAGIIQSEAELIGTWPDNPQTTIGDRQATETKRSNVHYDIQLNVHKRYRENILEGNRILLSFNKSFVTNPQVLEKIRSKAQKAFKISQVDNFDELVKSQLSDLKGQFIDAIANRKINIIEELCTIYFGIAEGYLSSMDPYGGGFSFEQARSERASAFMGGWEQMRWLVSDVRSLVIEAIQSKNQEILIETIGLPFRISRLALQNDDHYLFQEFSWFPSLFYRYSQKDQVQQDIKEYLFEKSLKYYQDLSNYYIETKFEKDFPKDKINSLKNFALTILLTYQTLMKVAFDNKDFEGFNNFQQTTSSIFSKTTTGLEQYEIEFKKSQLKNPDLPKEIREQFESQLEKQMIIQEIHNRRLQMFFGLTSWIFNEYKKFQSDEIIKGFYESIHSTVSISLEELTKIFLDVHSYDTESFWNWDEWDTIPDGKVYSIRILEKLENFYVVKALSMLAGQSHEKIDQIELPYNRDFAFLAEGNRDLIKTLIDIEKNPENWRFVLSEDEISKVSDLKNLLSRAKERQEKEDIERKRTKKISEVKVDTFKEDFIKGFYENADLRKFIENISTIENNLSEKPKEATKRFGFNTVDDKAAFFDDWYVYFGDWGKSYGRNLAIGENSTMLNKIIESCERLSGVNLESTLIKFANINDILILLVNVSPFNLFQNEDGFRYKESLTDISHSGVYQFQGIDIPIYQFFLANVDKQLIILDKNIINKLVQYSPLNAGEHENLIKDIFYMNIQSFSENENLMNEMLRNPPDWLKENRDNKSQRLYLEERVLIKIQECFELFLSNDFRGVSILVDD